MYRTEKDALGTLQIDAEAYYGIFTERAKKNFDISGIKVPFPQLKALATIKKAAAKANSRLGLLDTAKANAISVAASEISQGKHAEQFPLDIFQAGAGTPLNMNMNEVIANIAIEILGGKKGQYSIVHPNNDVNMAQSSNDVIPTAIRLCLIPETQKLLSELEKLSGALAAKAELHKEAIRTGRTHLQDAVPMTFGQMFRSYSTSIELCIKRIRHEMQELEELGIGGTAIGTGIATHPGFKQAILEELKAETGLDLRLAEDTIQTTSSASTFLQLSGSIRTLAVETSKICDDLMLLNSGPKTAIAEIELPEVEPGSSIMPGKVNPSITECMRMICFEAIGNDTAVMESARSGQLELNVNTPLIAHKLLSSISLLTNGAKMLREQCIDGIKVNTERAAWLAENSHIMATALNPYLGYEVMAEIVKKSLSHNKTITQAILDEKLMSPEQLNSMLQPEKTTKPQATDTELAARIKSSHAYADFKSKIAK